MSNTVRNIDIPWATLVRQADPAIEQARRKELFYTFTAFGPGRNFYNNPLTAGAYGDTRQFLTDEFGRIISDEAGAGIVIEE